MAVASLVRPVESQREASLEKEQAEASLVIVTHAFACPGAAGHTC